MERNQTTRRKTDKTVLVRALNNNINLSEIRISSDNKESCARNISLDGSEIRDSTVLTLSSQQVRKEKKKKDNSETREWIPPDIEVYDDERELLELRKSTEAEKERTKAA